MSRPLVTTDKTLSTSGDGSGMTRTVTHSNGPSTGAAEVPPQSGGGSPSVM